LMSGATADHMCTIHEDVERS